MNTEQLALDLSPRPPAPVSTDDVAFLTRYLWEHPEWLSAKRLAEALDIADRKIRQLAQHSDGQIISGPGCPGYKHIDHCTLEEIDHACNQLESQGKSMIGRSVRIRNRSHQTLR